MDLFRVYTGIIDISTIDDHFYRTADEVIVHRDYNPVMYTTDIGLLRLKRNITYNSFIKPVCLYNRTVDISTFYGREGKVTGWGFNRDGVISNVLNYLEVPVVSQKMCSQRNVQFNGVLAVGESFCAGHADGTCWKIFQTDLLVNHRLFLLRRQLRVQWGQWWRISVCRRPTVLRPRHRVDQCPASELTALRSEPVLRLYRCFQIPQLDTAASIVDRRAGALLFYGEKIFISIDTAKIEQNND